MEVNPALSAAAPDGDADAAKANSSDDTICDAVQRRSPALMAHLESRGGGAARREEVPDAGGASGVEAEEFVGGGDASGVRRKSSAQRRSSAVVTRLEVGGGGAFGIERRKNQQRRRLQMSPERLGLISQAGAYDHNC
ncbi:unnamed protein product [Miscanthus lutarioriparius]|uniref:Uncharacterized protein n=1 Tax=Miscanthus lutarioriparius TaxID=422564 RepID=A0A811QEM2_9POAL|nr:unnamed protein product [Miscanthus lutarioriparius]